MKREFLEGLELEQETVDQIMAEHGRTLNTTKEELTSAQSERDSYKQQLSERDTQLEDLKKKATGNEEMQSQIDSLKQANEEAKQAFQKQLKDQKFNYELDKQLTGANARDPKTVRALLDTETVKLEDDGTIKGLQEQVEGLKESHWYLFAGQNTDPNAGGGSGNNPSHTPGSGKKTNNPKQVEPVEAGRQKAMERHNKEEE